MCVGRKVFEWSIDTTLPRNQATAVMLCGILCSPLQFCNYYGNARASTVFL